MRLSNIIYEMIKRMIEESGGDIEIGRNELAGRIGCVPSQINYVLSSRFTPENGYIIESRRGGGGYIRIRRVRMDSCAFIMHLVNCIGDSIDAASADVIADSLFEKGILSEKETRIVKTALSDSSYGALPREKRDQIRARVFKNILVRLI